jgi:hypothetical protein
MVTPVEALYQKLLDRHSPKRAAQRSRGKRSAASNVFPNLDRNNPTGRAANPNPGGSAAERLYPHLPSESRSRMRRRRIYGTEE